MYVGEAIANAAHELCHKGDFSPDERMKGIFVYVQDFMLTLFNMQSNSTFM